MSLRNETIQDIQNNCNNFRTGNRSAWFLERSENRFFKLWSQMAPAHYFLLSENYNALVSLGMVAKLKEYGKINCVVRGSGSEYNYAYVFSSLYNDTLDAQKVLIAISNGELWWIEDLYLFFRYAQLAGYAFYDVDWDNLGINSSNSERKVVFFDVDSSLSFATDPNNLQGGNQNFHTLFVRLSSQLDTTNLIYFNVAVLAEIYIATVFAYATDDYEVLQRNRFNVNSYYNNNRISLPTKLSLTTDKRPIVERFLRTAIDCSLDAANEARQYRDVFNELRKSARTAINELNTISHRNYRKVVGIVIIITIAIALLLIFIKLVF